MPVKRTLFVFDDVIAIAHPDSLALLAQAAGHVVHHGVGEVASAALFTDRAELKKQISRSGEDLTVEDLRSEVDRISSVPTHCVRQIRLTTAVYPVTQAGGVDLNFAFKDLEWNDATKATNQRAAVLTLKDYKQHVKATLRRPWRC